MSKPRDRRAASANPSKQSKRPAPAPSTPQELPTELRPLRPQRVLFVVLALVLVALLAAMLILYFTTVYPYRHHI